MWVCESISPGSTVAEERSITVAPVGICAEASVNFSMRFPRTKINWFFRGDAFEPSISVPARITVISREGVGVCARMGLVRRSNGKITSTMCFFMNLPRVSRDSLPEELRHCNTFGRKDEGEHRGVLREWEGGLRCESGGPSR